MTISAPQQSNAQILRDRTNQQIGRIESDGTVRDATNRQIGKFDSDGRIRDRINQQAGKIDSDGTVRDKTNRQIGKVESNGFVRDHTNLKIGRIDSDGTVRDATNAKTGSAKGIKIQWAAAYFFFDFFEKKAAVTQQSNFDYKDGFHDGFAAVKVNGKWGYIRTDGSYLIEPIYSSAGRFSEGFAAVQLNDKWGYIRKDGSYLIEPQFSSATSFSNGLATVKANNQWGLLSSGGDMILSLDPAYEIRRVEYDKKRLIVRELNDYCVLDFKGNPIIKFDSIGQFDKSGFCIVAKDKKYGFLRKDGFLIDPVYQNVEAFKDGVAIVKLSDYKTIQIDMDGKMVKEIVYFDQAYEQAKKLYSEKKYEEAIEKLNKIVNEADKDKKTEIYNMLGDAYRLTKQNTKAIETLEKVDEQHRDYLVLGYAYESAGNPVKSIEMLKIAITKEQCTKQPINMRKAYSTMGDMYRQTDYYDEAIDSYQKAIEIDQSGSGSMSKWYYKDIGDCYLKQGNNNEAIRNYRKAADLGNEYATDALKKVPTTTATTPTTASTNTSTAASTARQSSSASVSSRTAPAPAAPGDNRWLIGTWEVKTHLGVMKLIISDGSHFTEITQYGIERGTYTVKGDEMTLFYDQSGSVPVTLDRTNQALAAGEGYYYRKVAAGPGQSNNAAGGSRYQTYQYIKNRTFMNEYTKFATWSDASGQWKEARGKIAKFTTTMLMTFYPDNEKGGRATIVVRKMIKSDYVPISKIYPDERQDAVFEISQDGKIIGGGGAAVYEIDEDGCLLSNITDNNGNRIRFYRKIL
jgi:predicted negative regulator of RcsB-dependent stress response